MPSISRILFKVLSVMPINEGLWKSSIIENYAVQAYPYAEDQLFAAYGAGEVLTKKCFN